MLGQIYRFVIVGLLNTGIDFAVFNLLISASGIRTGPGLLLINITAVLVAIVNSYILNRIWTFKSSDPNYTAQLPKFLTASLTGMIINTVTVGLVPLLLWPGTAPTSSALNVAKLLAAILSASWNFISYRHWVFKKYDSAAKFPPYQPGLISIVIPAYNEALRLPERLQNLASTLPSSFPVEIIVVDDGSTDTTAAITRHIAETFPQISCISYKRNRGKGKAVRTGMLAARGEFLIFADADNTFTPRHIESLVAKLKAGNSIAIACRHGTNGQRIEGESWLRHLMGKCFNQLVQAILLPGIKDSQCGLKGFHYQAAQEIFCRQHLNGFAFDVEILTLARALGYEIAELEVKAIDCNGSRVNPLLAPVQMLVDLFRVRNALFFNTYALPGGNRDILRSGLLLGVFIVALGLRLPWLWEIPRFIDELKEVSLAYLIYTGQLLPLHNAAQDIGAMHNYILAGIFKILGPSIYLPRFYVAITAALTVPLLYHLGTRLYGRRVGLLAAALLLFNGMHILVTHMAWSNCTTPFFFTLALIATLNAEEKKSGPWLVIAALLWAATLQTHSSAIIYVIAAAIYLLRPSFRQQTGIQLRWYSTAALTLLGGYANMIYFNIISRGGSLRWLGHKSYALEQNPGLISYLKNLHNMLVELGRTLSSTYSSHDHLLQYLTHPLFSLSLVLLLMGTVLAWKQKKTLPLWMIAAGFLIIPILNQRYSFFLATRYIMPVFICGLLLMAAGAIYVYDRTISSIKTRRAFQATAITTAALLVCLQFVPYYNYCRSKEVTNESNRLALDLVTLTQQLASQADTLILLDQKLPLENKPLPYLLTIGQQPYQESSFDSWPDLVDGSGRFIAILSDENYKKLSSSIKGSRVSSFTCTVTLPQPAKEERKVHVVFTR
ncbi:MAG TPA: glycosyltransferase [Gelria sp.]|nr:glycosyltransferase [Gelria sp.]